MKSKICKVCETAPATKGNFCDDCKREHRRRYQNNLRAKQRKQKPATPPYPRTPFSCALAWL